MELLADLYIYQLHEAVLVPLSHFMVFLAYSYFLSLRFGPISSMFLNTGSGQRRFLYFQFHSLYSDVEYVTTPTQILIMTDILLVTKLLLHFCRQVDINIFELPTGGKLDLVLSQEYWQYRSH